MSWIYGAHHNVLCSGFAGVNVLKRREAAVDPFFELLKSLFTISLCKPPSCFHTSKGKCLNTLHHWWKEVSRAALRTACFSILTENSLERVLMRPVCVPWEFSEHVQTCVFSSFSPAPQGKRGVSFPPEVHSYHYSLCHLHAQVICLPPANKLPHLPARTVLWNQPNNSMPSMNFTIWFPESHVEQS